MKIELLDRDSDWERANPVFGAKQQILGAFQLISFSKTALEEFEKTFSPLVPDMQGKVISDFHQVYDIDELALDYVLLINDDEANVLSLIEAGRILRTVSDELVVIIVSRNFSNDNKTEGLIYFFDGIMNPEDGYKGLAFALLQARKNKVQIHKAVSQVHRSSRRLFASDGQSFWNRFRPSSSILGIALAILVCGLVVVAAPII